METVPEIYVDYSAELQWINGVPTVVGIPIENKLTEVKMKVLLSEVLNLPYDGKDPRYVGLTKGEAMIIDLVDQASRGDSTARKEVLDRALGRPVQNIKSISVRGTIEEFLDNLDKRPDDIEIAETITLNEAEDL